MFQADLNQLRNSNVNLLKKEEAGYYIQRVPRKNVRLGYV